MAGAGYCLLLDSTMSLRYVCPICRSVAEWRVCFECAGAGGDDMGTLDEETCYECDGDGGWWQCPNHHNADAEREAVS